MRFIYSIFGLPRPYARSNDARIHYTQNACTRTAFAHMSSHYSVHGMVLLIALLVILLLSTIAAHAATNTTSSASTEEGEEISVEVNKGTLVHLPRAATTVLISNPEIADVQIISPSLVSVNGRSIGETTLIAVDGGNREILNRVVSVTHNISKLNKALKASLPDTQNVQFKSVDGALVLQGSVDTPLEAADISRLATPFLRNNQSLVNMLRVEGSDQVTLQVRVAEVSRTELKRFGINMENLLQGPGNFVFGLATGRDVVDNLGALTRSGLDNSLFIGHRTGNSAINGVIDALENQGLMKILAEPNLTAMSGRTATFLAGGEFPVPSLNGSGSDATVSIAYRPFGVNLSFTPTVMNKEKISLTVAPEVSALSQVGAVQVQGFNIPSLITRRTQTTVELGSGESFAVAGLIQNDTSNDISKFPGLGDIPVIGSLFRSSEFRHDQTELVIIVTPYIVRPVAEKTLMTPADGLQQANDFERILLGKLYREQPPAGDHPANDTLPSALPVKGSAEKEDAANDSDNAANVTEDSATIPADPDMPKLTGPAGFMLAPEDNHTSSNLPSENRASDNSRPNNSL